VSKSQRISNPQLTFWFAIAAFLLFAFLTGWVIWQLRPARVLAKRQAALIEGIEKRSASRIGRLVSEGYSDRWGFTREDAVEAVLDVGSQFFTLILTSSDQEMNVDEDWAVIQVRLELSGKPVGPVGNEATRRLNQLEPPFEFTWKKESFLPTSWKLVMIENSGLPDELYGYEPGDIRRALRGE
jgi:hypothetical protein